MANRRTVIALLVVVMVGLCTVVTADTAVGSPRIAESPDREQSRQVDGSKCEWSDELE